ncbi:gluconate:H+ symporter [uncultured Mailhella sp.]|uniref:GntT/GntP/DsdX family permease n=1 Tax=uncultured Mailhella sp. TaxID=1981031 RepID=UPI0025F7F465|nr:gluconate:H+ symporter [uncultured Mailhella sp.]
MGTTGALIILAITIVGIVLLCVRFKVHAFLALTAACIFLGLASGMPLGDIGGSIEKGMGGTLGFLAPILALGAFMGKMLEVSGGASRLAHSFISLFGQTKAYWAMLIIGYICGIPVFAQVGMVLLMPLAFSISKEAKLSILLVALSLYTGLLVVHCVVPPHPAAMAVANDLHADVGRVFLYGLVFVIPGAIIGGPLFARQISKAIHVPLPANAQEARQDRPLPSFGCTLFLTLLPLILMIGKTIVEVSSSKDAAYLPLVEFLGHPVIALFISAVASILFLGVKRGFTSDELSDFCSKSLLPMVSILLVIGAAGSFNKVIMDCGMGDVLKKVLISINMHPVIMAWLIASILRFALGSATVAMMTSAGFITPVLTVHPVDPALMCIAIGAGAIGWSHVTDSGFWFFREFLNMSVKDMYLSFTLSGCIVSIITVIICYFASFIL